jgi:hypothetical protein
VDLYREVEEEVWRGPPCWIWWPPGQIWRRQWWLSPEGQGPVGFRMCSAMVLERRGGQQLCNPGTGGAGKLGIVVLIQSSRLVLAAVVQVEGS